LDFSQALTFQFKDPNWLSKLLIAALVSLIPVIGQLLILGWSLEITRRVIARESQELPQFDFSIALLRGLKAWGINLVYALPALVIAFPLGTGLGLIIAATDGRAAVVWTLAALCLTGVLIVYGLILALILPAAYGNLLAQQEQFSAGLDLKRIYQLVRRGPLAYLLVLIGGFLCGLITMFGLVGCIIGVVATGVYSSTVMAHLYGQAYLETQLYRPVSYPA